MVTTRRLAVSACISVVVVAAGIARSQQGNTAPPKGVAGTSAIKGLPPVLRRPPFPNATIADEILANISWGIKQMRMDEVPGQEALGGPLVAERILDVESGSRESDYYVVELAEPNGKPLADVLIGKDGRVRSVWRYQAGAPRRKAPDLNEVTRRLTQRFGPTRARYYHTINTVEVAGGSFYVPLIVADTPAGRVFVNSKLEMFVEESFKRFTRSGAEEFEESRKNKASEHVLIKKNGIGKLKKLGKL